MTTSWIVTEVNPKIGVGPTHFLKAPGGHIVANLFADGTIELAVNDNAFRGVSPKKPKWLGNAFIAGLCPKCDGVA